MNRRQLLQSVAGFVFNVATLPAIAFAAQPRLKPASEFNVAPSRRKFLFKAEEIDVITDGFTGETYAIWRNPHGPRHLTERERMAIPDGLAFTILYGCDYMFAPDTVIRCREGYVAAVARGNCCSPNTTTFDMRELA